MGVPKALVWVAVAAGAVTCVLPTDRSSGLRVELAPLPTLLLKDSLRLSPAVVDSAGTALPNAALGYASSDPTVLLVDAAGVVRAVGVGTATLTVSALGFAEAEAFSQDVRVRGKIEVDSIRPLSARFGDSVEIFGVGLQPDSLFSISVGGVEDSVSAFIPVDPERPEREAMLRVWVAPPADRRSAVTLLGFAGGLVFPDTVDVLQRDLYEPNDTVPRPLGALPNGFHNPALALEARLRETQSAAGDRQPADWFVFDNPTKQDRTVAFLSQGGLGQAFGVILTDSLAWSSAARTYVPGPNAWAVGIQQYLCSGRGFTRNGEAVAIEEVLFPLSIIAIKGLPPGRYHVLVPFVAFGTPTAYALTVANQYASVLPPDAAEENDYCDVAAALPPSNSGSFTIDNPHDIDWFRFTVPVSRAFTATVTAQNPDADLDLYLVRDFRPDSLILVNVGSGSGTTESVSAVLPPGNYFLVVVDFQGQPTGYTMGITAGATTGTVEATVAGVAEVDAAVARLRAKARPIPIRRYADPPIRR